MKKLMISFCFGLIITFGICTHFSVLESTISKNVIRLHIIADDNSKDEQALKLKVRDAVLLKTKDIFTNDVDILSAKNNIKNNLGIIEKTAKEEIIKNGYNHDVNVTFEKSYFPTKVYGKVTLPLGTYDAVKVKIGKAKGNNWWCVMFPPLCFTNGASAKLDDDYFKNNLSDNEISFITTKKSPQIKLEFKLYELWQKLKKAS
ncbi:MAG: stage II sporulation protein R [Ruminococcaceae bacterium]|nr:stage II sporulation protein R [Oscillospiraceae bacterium]